MNVYVESNFVLELALVQERSRRDRPHTLTIGRTLRFYGQVQ